MKKQSTSKYLNKEKFVDDLQKITKKDIDSSLSIDDILDQSFFNQSKKRTEYIKLFSIYWNSLLTYWERNEKDWDVEYQILQNYWKFINLFLDGEISHFNELIILINKYTYTPQKGYITNE